MSEQALSILFLVISVVSMAAQSTSVARMVRWHYGRSESRSAIHRGLVRTAACRAFAAVLYVGFGVLSLTHPDTTAVASLIVFSGVQAMWIMNSILDNRLKRQLGDD